MPMAAFHHGTHYSRSGAVIWYLMRLEPWTSTHIYYQDGQFDNPDRLFSSVEAAYRGSTTKASHAMELLPQFFYMPEMLVNVNSLDLGTKQDGTLVGDVALPPWANGSPSEFVRIHREALESEHVSQNLHHWIDLIFGHKQRPPWVEGGGRAAVEACNVFFYATYSGAIDMEAPQQHPHLRSVNLRQIGQFGQCPDVLFSGPHAPRGS